MKVIVWGKQHPADLLGELDTMKIKYTHIPNPSQEQLKQLVTKMRSFRDVITINPKYIDHETYKNRWRFDELIKPPILEIENDLVYPAWYINNQGILERSSFLCALKDKQDIDNDNRQKLKIKRITKSHKQTDKITMSKTSEARVNVTILRAINGINIYDIMDDWSDEEKAAGMVLWRLAQHNKSSDMMLIAEMLINKAKTADPYTRIDDYRPPN